MAAIPLAFVTVLVPLFATSAWAHFVRLFVKKLLLRRISNWFLLFSFILDLVVDVTLFFCNGEASLDAVRDFSSLIPAFSFLYTIFLFGGQLLGWIIALIRDIDHQKPGDPATIQKIYLHAKNFGLKPALALLLTVSCGIGLKVQRVVEIPFYIFYALGYCYTQRKQGKRVRDLV